MFLCLVATGNFLHNFVTRDRYCDEINFEKSNLILLGTRLKNSNLFFILEKLIKPFKDKDNLLIG